MPARRPSRREVLRYLGLFGAVSVGAVSPFSSPVVASSESGSNSAYTTENTTIESFDETEIAATEYTPDGEGPFPSVLITHGWANDRKTDGPTSLANLYASNGYFVLTYDSRGFGASGGKVGVDGSDEIRDVEALITYLADHDKVVSDGDDPVVGMDGFSYAAGIQLRAAAADDRLDAIIPRWAWHDLRFSNDPNGVIKWPWFYLLYVSGLLGSLGIIPGRRGRDANSDGMPDVESEFLKLSQKALAEGEAPPALREFWASTSPGPQDELGEIEAATLLIHGWHDRLFTPNEAFANYRGLQESTAEARLLMYNGGHDLVGAPGDKDDSQIAFLAGAALRFFRRHLKGKPVPEAKQLSPVTLYREASGSFESYEQLPTGEQTLSLRESTGPGTTRLTTGPGGSATAAFDFDVAEPTDLAGAGELTLRLTPRGGRPILSAALVKIGTDGASTILKDQVAVTPVEGRGNTTVSLDLIGVEATLNPGDTLRLVVGVSDDQLAPFLTDENILGTFPTDQPPVDEYIPDSLPSTDGLYFDSPEEPSTGVVIQHTRPGESALTLRTVSTDTEQSENKRGKQRSRRRRSLPTDL